MEPTDPVKLAEYLERLLAGLDQTAESLKFEIPYYKADDIQGHYAKKFLASVLEQAAGGKLHKFPRGRGGGEGGAR